jgi:HSP90 family molecular chaperone
MRAEYCHKPPLTSTAVDSYQITEEEHKKFYKWVSGAWDVPMYTLHYAADAPVQLKALFYIGQTHSEKLGLGRVEAGVSLYSRKVMPLIASKILTTTCNLVEEWGGTARNIF